MERRKKDVFYLEQTISINIEPHMEETEIIKLLYYHKQFYLILDLESLIQYVNIQEHVKKEKENLTQKRLTIKSTLHARFCVSTKHCQIFHTRG